MNEELKKAYRLVDLDLRRRNTGKHSNLSIQIFDIPFNNTRLEIDEKAIWCSSISDCVLELEKIT